MTTTMDRYEADFVALDFTNSEKNRYAYQMVGIDPDWVSADDRRFASYPDLDPGPRTRRRVRDDPGLPTAARLSRARLRLVAGRSRQVG